MFRWFIAWKYLGSRFITAAAFLLVSLSVAILIILMAVMEGFHADMIERIRGTAADMKVDSQRFEGFERGEELRQLVESTPGVRGAVPYVETMVTFNIKMPPRISNVFDGYPTFLAIDTAAEARLGRLDDYVRFARPRQDSRLPESALLPADTASAFSEEWVEKGLWAWNRARVRFAPFPSLVATDPPEDPKERRPLLIGDQVLGGLEPELRDLMIGRPVELTTISPVTNEARRLRCVLAGFFKTKDVTRDNHTVMMELAHAEEFLALADPQSGRRSIGGLRVFLEPEEEAERVRSELVARLAGAEVPFFEVRTWREEKAKTLQAVVVEKALVGFILGVIVLFVGLMVFIILTVQMVERMRDLGVLLAVGSDARGVSGIYLRIGGVICAAGVLVGVIVGVGFCRNLDLIQRWVYVLFGWELFPKHIYYIEKIPARLVPSDFLLITLPTVLTGFLASLFVARRAASKNPVEALRHE